MYKRATDMARGIAAGMSGGRASGISAGMVEGMVEGMVVDMVDGMGTGMVICMRYITKSMRNHDSRLRVMGSISTTVKVAQI